MIMQSFSTEFPINDEKTGDDFLFAVKKWVLGSRYTHFREQHLTALGVETESRITVATDTLEILRIVTDNTESIAVSYHKREENCDWISKIVFSDTPSSNWVSVRVLCEPHHPTAKLPTAKKPVLMQILLDALGGGRDGELTVSNKPLLLQEGEVELATNFILGTTATYLPIVYVSAPFRGQTDVDVEHLAKKLVGMAHVIVEPSRAFSLRLMTEVRSQNAYGGAIGVYWPEGEGSRKFLNGQAERAGEAILDAVFDEIRLALNNRRPLTRCTWSAVKELQSRRILNDLKDAGSTNVQNYIDAFDVELEAKNAALADAEKEIQRLSAEIRRYEAQTPSIIGLTLSLGQEHDYFPGEIKDIVIDALSVSRSLVPEDSRRLHIIDAVLSANNSSGQAIEIKERLKIALRNYKVLDAKTQRELLEIGFVLSDGGKHHKLTWNSDNRYTYSLSKTPSDHRTGLNSISDISRLFF
jgi:hypothetical protein